jgi:GH15 family glucan-1,4-alpha-glucosidase
MDDRIASIEEHGLIGDLRTAALVATDGAIDWFCPERFDAPSVFGAILDPEKGGHWRLAPEGAGSGPLRPGNAAAKQLQLDI